MTEPITHVKPRPVVLCVLDGWGERAETENNAIALGHTPVWDRLAQSSPRARLIASEGDVGLPAGQMGNSEVGHMNLGSGRIVMQDLPRIDKAFDDGSFEGTETYKEMVSRLRETGGVCHVLGLMSPGGVHAHQDHLEKFCRLLSDAGIPVAVHAFMDGRDTPPNSGLGYINRFSDAVAGMNGVRIATVMGRFFALDRDERWDRVEKAYAAIVSGAGVVAVDGAGAVAAAYNAGQSDEFVEPAVVEGYEGMKDGDGIFMASYRADRAREILSALADPAFAGFSRSRCVDFSTRMGMIEYSHDLSRFYGAIFLSQEVPNTLGETVSRAGLRQLRIAETEKYAHVTFFLNGGREEEYDNEDRILVPSPRVATYDLCPEMSAAEVTDNLVRVIDDGLYDLIVVNYANGDMVGHTGVLEAAMKAAETLDHCLGRLEVSVQQAGGTMLVTADHGNCENMTDETGGIHTQHTLNMVPVLLVNAPSDVRSLHDGRLCDVAPTLLRLLGIAQPSEMTGCSLIEGDGVQNAVAE
ncbi:MAG: 2,3-bisphosphoglycerate-independent phosphoglycerate mutase [Rhodospirillales bacterium]|nr:2,3-bisphosphoglycerate-independent phosphoglycerate mutase [Rhodospirillales bacterium]